MSIEKIAVPDVGGGEVEVIEISVAVGDVVAVDDTLVVLESDKASMEVPSPHAGKITEILLAEGDKVEEGVALVVIETDATTQTASEAPASVVEEAPAPRSEPAAVAASSTMDVAVPDVGGEAEVVEISVAVGDPVAEEDTLCVLESDKASMEVPCPAAGTIASIAIKEGDKVSEGTPLLVLTIAGAVAESAPAASTEVSAPAPESAPISQAAAPVESAAREIAVPDIGGEAEVVEISVAEGDSVVAEDTLCVLESDKASMEVPCPEDGTVVKWLIQSGDKVTEGTPMMVLKTASAAPAPVASSPAPVAEAPTPAPVAAEPKQDSAPVTSAKVYAGPVVRKLARELGVDLAKVSATGPRGRILKEDVQQFVKQAVAQAAKPQASQAASGGAGIPAVPPVDFGAFGDIRTEPLTKIQKVTAANMQRAWLNVPHVTQFDDIDITELEAFRKSMKEEAAVAGVKLTPLPFLLKACAAALRKNPMFNSSLHHDGEHIVYKDYVHIGVAVDTPNGLMVPVIRDVDKKGLYQLAEESVAMAKAAKDRKLKPTDMKGGCFSISSLGNIGGKGFTPIVSPPEVGILGVSRLSTQPVWNGSEFVPRKMLPLSLSYDHRVINGADAGRFFADLAAYLTDVRRLLV